MKIVSRAISIDFCCKTRQQAIRTSSMEIEQIANRIHIVAESKFTKYLHVQSQFFSIGEFLKLADRGDSYLRLEKRLGSLGLISQLNHE
jgi:hypothetical protein